MLLIHGEWMGDSDHTVQSETQNDTTLGGRGSVAVTGACMGVIAGWLF